MAKKKVVDNEGTYEFTQAQQNANTGRATECHIRLFVTWLQHMNELRQPEEIDNKDLDLYLVQFSLGVQKEADGDLNDPVHQYEPLTLVAMHSSIHRYLSAKGYKGNIKIDDAFRHFLLLSKKN